MISFILAPILLACSLYCMWRAFKVVRRNDDLVMHGLRVNGFSIASFWGWWALEVLFSFAIVPIMSLV